MTKNAEYQGTLFIYQEEKDFEFLIPHDNVHTGSLPY